jgi:hypothetical protein
VERFFLLITNKNVFEMIFVCFFVMTEFVLLAFLHVLQKYYFFSLPVVNLSERWKIEGGGGCRGVVSQIFAKILGAMFSGQDFN